MQQSCPPGGSSPGQPTLALPPQGLQTSVSSAMVTGCFVFEKANQRCRLSGSHLSPLHGELPHDGPVILLSLCHADKRFSAESPSSLISPTSLCIEKLRTGKMALWVKSVAKVNISVLIPRPHIV